jgi:hypothetical protein
MMESQGNDADQRKQQRFFEFAEQLRSAINPKDVYRLGEQMGRTIFGR